MLQRGICFSSRLPGLVLLILLLCGGLRNLTQFLCCVQSARGFTPLTSSFSSADHSSVAWWPLFLLLLPGSSDHLLLTTASLSWCSPQESQLEHRLLGLVGPPPASSKVIAGLVRLLRCPQGDQLRLSRSLLGWLGTRPSFCCPWFRTSCFRGAAPELLLRTQGILWVGFFCSVLHHSLFLLKLAACRTLLCCVGNTPPKWRFIHTSCTWRIGWSSLAPAGF